MSIQFESSATHSDIEDLDQSTVVHYAQYLSDEDDDLSEPSYQEAFLGVSQTLLSSYIAERHLQEDGQSLTLPQRKVGTYRVLLSNSYLQPYMRSAGDLRTRWPISDLILLGAAQADSSRLSGSVRNRQYDLPVPAAYRRMWVALIILSVVWGFVGGIAFATPGWLITPATAVFGLFATIVLALTLNAMGKK